LGDPNALAEVAQGVEVLYHCAAENSPRAPAAAFSWVNIAATENVLNAARHAGVRRVVHLSCADATLINADRLNWKETQPMTELPVDALSRSKLLAEELAISAISKRLQVCVLRPAWIWGPGDRRTLPALCREAQGGRIGLCGSGENLVPSVHIDNLLHGLRLADRAEDANGKIIHVLDAEVQTARELISGFCQSVGLPPPVRGLYPLSYARAWLNERLGLPGLCRADVIRRGRSALFDGMAAARELGYTPIITMPEGLAKLAEWAAAIGGRDVLAQLAPPPATQADIDALIRLADAQGPASQVAEETGPYAR
ncbi:MAG: NAD-dependent epimerase/dehydratase family protein, partial [Polyangiales bacterium]